MFASINPTTGEMIAHHPAHDEAEAERRLDAAWAGWTTWRATPMAVRAAFLDRLAALLDDRAERYGLLVTLEMGKPLREAVAELRKCAATARHYASAGDGYIAPRTTATEARLAEVRFEPLGPVLAIMPWNYPFWQVFRFFIPAALAGNTAVVKHAENVQGCAQAVEEAVRDAGGEGLLVNLAVGRDEVARLIADCRVRAVTLTGSVRAGRSVGAAAGAAGKKAVLELGGSDPFIVLADADLARVVPAAVTARFANAGQSCISAKRFLVANTIAGRFVDAFAAAARDLRLGDPRDPATTMGPLAREDLRDGFADQVRRSLAAGARAVLGGGAPEGPGFFHEATILTHVVAGSPAASEELFGPAAAVMSFATLDEAVALANGTDFGLGASVWSEDVEAASALADQIEAGAVFVNDLVRSDPRLPFGGIKDSGHGRELGEIGAREFTNAKLKWVA